MDSPCTPLEALEERLLASATLPASLVTPPPPAFPTAAATVSPPPVGTYPERIEGDANLDGTVDIFDFIILKINYGRGDGVGWEQGDFDLDGDVDIADFTLLKRTYGLTLQRPT